MSEAALGVFQCAGEAVQNAAEGGGLPDFFEEAEANRSRHRGSG